MADILLAGTYDSKAQPYAALERAIHRLGGSVRTIDIGVYGSDAPVDIPATKVAEAAGHDLADIGRMDRAEALASMVLGATTCLAPLVRNNETAALIVMGGSNAAMAFSELSRQIPFGIPKIFMGTFASGDTRGLINARDVVLMYPVVDIEGRNGILDDMIERLARTAVALACDPAKISAGARPRRIAISMYGVTTPCAKAIAGHFEHDGLEALTFHANGTGGRSIENFAAEGLIDGLADITIAELANEVVGGAFPAGRDRMTSAARAGIAQVIAPGALDMIAFGPAETVPAKFRDHKKHKHNALVTLIRTTPDECRDIGRALARRLGSPTAPTSLCIPGGGVSMLDAPGGVFEDPSALAAFRDGFVAEADGAIEVVEIDANINDAAFAALVHERLSAAMSSSNAMGSVRA